jgi:polyhydroxyalkanoate synthase
MVFLADNSVQRLQVFDRAEHHDVCEKLYRIGKRPPWLRKPYDAPCDPQQFGRYRQSFHGEGPLVLVVPSLINRFYVLDILPEHSFLRHLAKQGVRPVVVDWGTPGRQERHFDLTDYVAGRLEGAFAAATRIAGAPIGVVG